MGLEGKLKHTTFYSRDERKLIECKYFVFIFSVSFSFFYLLAGAPAFREWMGLYLEGYCV